MTNNEILEGLKTAIERNYTLEQAMISFFNAGYKKEDIEEAARTLYTNYPQVAAKAKLKKQNPKPENNPSPNISHQKTTQYPSQVQGQSQITQKPAQTPLTQQMPQKQNISKYESKTKPKSKLITILIIIILLIIIASAIGFFLFKDELMFFLHDLF